MKCDGYGSRPQFKSPAEYVAYLGEHFCAGERYAPWHPATGAELRAAMEAFPDEAHRWRPAPHVFEDGSTRPPIGTLADELRFALEGFSPEPLGEREQESILHTLATDGTFRRAFRAALGAA